MDSGTIKRPSDSILFESSKQSYRQTMTTSMNENSPYKYFSAVTPARMVHLTMKVANEPGGCTT